MGKGKKPRPARSLPDSLMWGGRELPLASLVINDFAGEVTAKYMEPALIYSSCNSPFEWDSISFFEPETGTTGLHPLAKSGRMEAPAKAATQGKPATRTGRKVHPRNRTKGKQRP